MKYNFDKTNFKTLLGLNLLDDKALEDFIKENCFEFKSIAFEFAKLGMAGIDPKKDNYIVPSIDKKMTGYQALAYYYVSWALAIPEHLAELQMPFEREYEVAQKMN